MVRVGGKRKRERRVKKNENKERLRQSAQQTVKREYIRTLRHTTTNKKKKKRKG